MAFSRCGSYSWQLYGAETGPVLYAVLCRVRNGACLCFCSGRRRLNGARLSAHLPAPLSEVEPGGALLASESCLCGCKGVAYSLSNICLCYPFICGPARDELSQMAFSFSLAVMWVLLFKWVSAVLVWGSGWSLFRGSTAEQNCVSLEILREFEGLFCCIWFDYCIVVYLPLNH